MLDPAIVALLDHMSYTPPAIMEPAPEFAVEPWKSVYEHMLKEHERTFDRWLAKGEGVRSGVWADVVAHPAAFTPQALTALIVQFERNINRQSRITKSLERQARKNDRRLSWIEDRLFDMQHRHYEAASDLALFLRALRAEISPSSRGGPVFDNAEDFERSLLAAVG